jgi:hypothetical protein
MGRQGIRYPKDEIKGIKEYVRKMVEDRRVIAVEDARGLHTVIFFSICEDPEPFLKKGTWEYRTHSPGGRFFYGEKIVSKGWQKDFRNHIKQTLLKVYPQLDTGTWHRWARWGDRTVTIRRKECIPSNSYATRNSTIFRP